MQSTIKMDISKALALCSIILISLLAGCQMEEKMTIAIIETNKGTFKAELFTEDAPITTQNFIDLAQDNFYDGLTWHRYVPGFVIQGGDPDGDGTGGSGKTIPLETSPKLKHGEGALSMARSPDPNSASSQFFVTLAKTPHLDGDYAMFGNVTEGMDVVKKLREGDRIIKITIE